MKIEIGCSKVGGCSQTAFAMIACDDFEAPVIGLLLPVGWGVEAFKTGVIDFYCPQHNPGLRKAGVTVEEKDQTVAKLSDSVSEPEDVEFVSVSIVDDPPDPLCRVKAEAHCRACGSAAPKTGPCPKCGIDPDAYGSGDFKPVTDPEKIVEIGKVDLKGHHHATKAGPTGQARYRAEDSEHTHNSQVGLATWAEENPGHTHLIDKVGSARTGPPIPREPEPTTVPKGRRFLQHAVYAAQAVLDRAVKDLAKARERVRGEQIGTVYRDGGGVVRIELEPGVEMGEAVTGLQRALACVQEPDAAERDPDWEKESEPEPRDV